MAPPRPARGRPEHPLLGAAVALAAGRRTAVHGPPLAAVAPWLADHAVLGAVLLPGSLFVELALYAGAQTGCELVQELALEAPLVLDERRAVQLQVVLGEPEDSGCRSIDVYARPEPAAGDGLEVEETWTRHAAGLLAPAPAHADGELAQREELAVLAAAAWPPRDAEPVEVEGVYERLAELGLDCGAAFQGLRAIWRRGEEVFAEVALAEEQCSQASVSRCTQRCSKRPCTGWWRRAPSGTSPRAACGWRLAGAGSSCTRAARRRCACASRRPARTRCR